MHAKADECGPACAAECAGVATFPLAPKHSYECVLLPNPGGAFALTVPLGCARCGRGADAHDPRVMAEAWRWRAANIPPDSAQSRRDAVADAETLRSAWGFSPWQYQVDATDALPDPNDGLGLWTPDECAIRAARAASEAVPALRGEP